MINKTIFRGIVLLSFLVIWTTPAYAHKNPSDCTGSGLGISLYASPNQVHIGETISYSADVFNGIGSGPIVCDASNIQASIVTPDGVTHPITLLRTSLTNGQIDTYSNVVTYVSRSQDIVGDALLVTASDIGNIHQNDTDSQGGGNQSVNTQVVVAVVPPSPPPSPPPQMNNTSGGRGYVTLPIPPTVIASPLPIIPLYFPNAGLPPEDESDQSESFSLLNMIISASSWFFQIF